MESPDRVMCFDRPAIVLKQPLLVALTMGFIVALLLAAFWPDGSEAAAPEPLPWWAGVFWLVVLALLALGGWMLCHAEEIVVDAARQRVTQVHRFLRREVNRNAWRFADFSAVVVTLQIDKEQQGESSPSGGATLATARTVYQRRYELSLRRPDLVVHTAERTLTAPAHALRLALPDGRDAAVVEAAARALAQLGGWPALRHHYTRRGGDVKVAAGADEPIAGA